jgi:hypothetical protein
MLTNSDVGGREALDPELGIDRSQVRLRWRVAQVTLLGNCQIGFARRRSDKCKAIPADRLKRPIQSDPVNKSALDGRIHGVFLTNKNTSSHC